MKFTNRFRADFVHGFNFICVCVQGDPSGCSMFKTNRAFQYKLLILKCNFSFNFYKTLGTTWWLTLYMSTDKCTLLRLLQPRVTWSVLKYHTATTASPGASAYDTAANGILTCFMNRNSVAGSAWDSGVSASGFSTQWTALWVKIKEVGHRVSTTAPSRTGPTSYETSNFSPSRNLTPPWAMETTTSRRRPQLRPGDRFLQLDEMSAGLIGEKVQWGMKLAEVSSRISPWHCINQGHLILSKWMNSKLTITIRLNMTHFEKFWIWNA